MLVQSSSKGLSAQVVLFMILSIVNMKVAALWFNPFFKCVCAHKWKILMLKIEKGSIPRKLNSIKYRERFKQSQTIGWLV